jgi:hypothetical protein
MTEIRALLLSAVLIVIVPAICGQDANRANYDEAKGGIIHPAVTRWS